MHRAITSRLAVLGRQSITNVAVPKATLPIAFRQSLAAKFHSTPIRPYIWAEVAAAQAQRDAASQERMAARRKELEEMSESAREQLLKEREEQRNELFRKIRETETKNWVDLEYMVQAVRSSALVGPNHRGAAVTWTMRYPSTRMLFQMKRDPSTRKSLFSKERIDVTNFRLLRFSRQLEVNVDEKWDGDLDAPTSADLRTTLTAGLAKEPEQKMDEKMDEKKDEKTA